MTGKGGNEDIDLAERALARHKREDAAAFLPIIGILLFVSPFLNIVTGFPHVFGIPAVYVYVFTAWAVLIFGTRRLARRLYGANPQD